MRSNIFVMLTTSFFIVACKPALTPTSITNSPTPKPNQKISDEQITEFTNFAINIGRLEELARVMKSRGQTWGTNDPVVAQLLAAVNGKCDAKFETMPSATPSSRIHTLEIVGTACPISLKYMWQYQSIADLRANVTMKGYFTVDSDSLAQANGLKALEMTARGTITDRRATERKFEINITGTGKATTFDGKIYTFAMNQNKVSRGSTAPFVSGSIKVNTPANFNVSLESSGSGYILNDRKITKEDYNTFIAKIGMIADGYKAIMDF